MKLTRAVLALALAALPFAACQKAPEPPPAPKAAETTQAPPSPVAKADDGVSVGDYTVIGLVTEVADAGYPMFALKILPDGAKDAIGLLYDNEGDARLGGDKQISEFKGQRAEIAYSRKATLDLVDVTLNGKKLMKHVPGDPVITPDATVTGKLSGATELSHGDLPDTITVTDAAGKTFDFDLFISDKPLVAANGKEVTASYTNGTREDMKAIKLAPPKP